VLGNSCYIGSNSNPIVLNLVTGTSGKLTGKEPTYIEDSSPLNITFKEGAYVDNSFAAPGASGCVLTLFGFIPISINGLVNSQSGLPAAAGTNATEQKFNMQLAAQEWVYP
jgi:hypothetical protein